MNEHTSASLARRASPYGLAILPETDQYEYTDPRTEAALERRWRSVCEGHGAAVLGIRAVPTSPVRLELDGITWELAPLGPEERGVPAEVYYRWRALEAAGVPFFYWLWSEELPERPRFQPVPATGTAEPRSGRAPVAPRPGTWNDRLAIWLNETLTRLDPIVSGVIPTAPQRGLWVLLGRWFH